MQDIPKDNLNAYKKGVNILDEDFKAHMYITMALEDGFGDSILSQEFTVSRLDNLNNLLKENNINHLINEEDFSM